MAITKYNARVVQKHDTKANWDKATNFIPLKGEIIVYDDLNKIKIGDGVTKVGSLAFVQPSPTDIGLGNVNNTSDANKPISSATQAALNQKLNLSGGTLTGALEVINKYELGSFYDYRDGYLIEIGAAANQTMVVIHITGNSYDANTHPIDSLYQFYDYTSNDTILQYSGINLGASLGDMKVYRHEGKLYAHIAQTRSFQTLSFTIITNKSGLRPKVTNATTHTSGYTNLITITPKDNITSGNISSQSVASATKATKDASGNTITSTYATKTELDTAKSGLQSSIDGKANSSHTHTIANVSGLQSALDGKSSTSHTHTTLTGVYTSNGGSQPPSYVGANAVKCNMMNQFVGTDVTSFGSYADVLQMNAYSWHDVPYATALAIQKTNGVPRAWIAAGGNTDSWAGATEIITKNNIGSQSVNYATSAGSASKLSTARTISLTGDVTGSTTFDGSSNVSITATVADSSHNHAASNITSGTLAVARGGTGVTANPSMLTNLGSTSAASVFAASPRPGVTGTLPVANGGTGATSVAGILANLGLTDMVAGYTKMEGGWYNGTNAMSHTLTFSFAPKVILILYRVSTNMSQDSDLNEGFGLIFPEKQTYCYMNITSAGSFTGGFYFSGASAISGVVTITTSGTSCTLSRDYPINSFGYATLIFNAKSMDSSNTATTDPDKYKSGYWYYAFG